jgi:hypothetical protein
MFHTLSYQLYTATEQQPADFRAGEMAAGPRDLRLCLGRAFRLRHLGRSARRAASDPPAVTAPGRALTSVR